MLIGTTLAGLLADLDPVVPFVVATGALVVSAVVAIRFVMGIDHGGAPHAREARRDGDTG